MINQIFSAEEITALPEKGIAAQKIRALYNAYDTSYDFCRFYRQGSSFISALDSSFVLCSSVDVDIDEISDFFRMSGFSDIFCTELVGTALAKELGASLGIINLLRYSNAEEISENINLSPTLQDVYSIIKDGFDIEFEPWYLDMSHRTRHGVTRCCTLDNKAALVIQHDINSEALISQVACRTSNRGGGAASRLVKATAAMLAPSEVFVLCEDRLLPFYTKCGFLPVGKYAILS